MKNYIKKILDKKFESVINGYSPYNVDSFLDSIISDFQTINKEKEEMILNINSLNKIIENLKEENAHLQKIVQQYKNNEMNEKKNDSVNEINERDKNFE